MKAVADIELEVRVAVFADRDRSVERAVELAVKAGMEHERMRVAAILELSMPPGLEKALIAYALHPSTTVDSAKEFIASFRLDPTQSASLRKGFRIVTLETKVPAHA